MERPLTRFLPVSLFTCPWPDALAWALLGVIVMQTLLLFTVV